MPADVFPAPTPQPHELPPSLLAAILDGLTTTGSVAAALAAFATGLEGTDLFDALPEAVKAHTLVTALLELEDEPGALHVLARQVGDMPALVGRARHGLRRMASGVRWDNALRHLDAIVDAPPPAPPLPPEHPHEAEQVNAALFAIERHIAERPHLALSYFAWLRRAARRHEERAGRELDRADKLDEAARIVQDLVDGARALVPSAEPWPRGEGDGR